MKNTAFSFIFICSIFFMMITSCERTDLQKSPNNNGVISPREVAECSECPNDDDCCCAIELQQPFGTASLALCGTTDAAGGCSAPAPPSPCIAISGGAQTTGTLDLNDPKHLFCMAPGNSFYIRNLTTSNANITITCQHDDPTPQTVTITIPGSTIYYFSTNNGCEVARCQ